MEHPCLYFVSNTAGLSSSIYYMIQAGDVTTWHRVGVDEYWCHHSGGNIRCHHYQTLCIIKALIRIRTLTRDGQLSEVTLGQLSSTHPNIRQQFLVPKDTYFKADIEVGKFKLWMKICISSIAPSAPCF